MRKPAKLESFIALFCAIYDQAKHLRKVDAGTIHHTVLHAVLVEGDLTKVIFNTNILSTDIFDHRILLSWNSQLRILDRRNFIHQNFEGGILYTEICTPEFSP